MILYSSIEYIPAISWELIRKFDISLRSYYTSVRSGRYLMIKKIIIVQTI